MVVISGTRKSRIDPSCPAKCCKARSVPSRRLSSLYSVSGALQTFCVIACLEQWRREVETPTPDVAQILPGWTNSTRRAAGLVPRLRLAGMRGRASNRARAQAEPGHGTFTILASPVAGNQASREELNHRLVKGRNIAWLPARHPVAV